jgi:hypothetical protein
MNVTYKVSELKNLISESSNEFKAKLGDSVEREDKKNNGKAYTDAKKRAKDFDGGLNGEVKPKEKYRKDDENGTTIDYVMQNAPDSFKKRVHAQVKGYSSELEENNGIEKQDDYSNNENIYQGIKKSGQERHKNIENFKASGLQASKMPKETFKKEEMYESKDGFDMRNMIDRFKSNSQSSKKPITEQKSVKTVFFKKTSFLNEGHMISRIPDEFKNEGVQFKMKDKNGTEYLVEWADNSANVISCNHKQKVDETMSKFNDYSSYGRERYKTSTANDRLNENTDEMSRMLNIMRTITNDEKNKN